jgi:hypothetical protein
MFAATAIIACCLALIQTWSGAAWLAAACLGIFWCGVAGIAFGEAVGYNRGFLLALLADWVQAVSVIAVVWSSAIGIAAFILALVTGFAPMKGFASR